MALELERSFLYKSRKQADHFQFFLNVIPEASSTASGVSIVSRPQPNVPAFEELIDLKGQVPSLNQSIFPPLLVASLQSP
jgi:hypothetical protein